MIVIVFFIFTYCVFGDGTLVHAKRVWGYWVGVGIIMVPVGTGFGACRSPAFKKNYFVCHDWYKGTVPKCNLKK